MQEPVGEDVPTLGMRRRAKQGKQRRVGRGWIGGHDDQLSSLRERPDDDRVGGLAPTL